MAKLALKAAPTFKASVGIPVAGGDPVPVEFTFKHRTKTALEEFGKRLPEKSELDATLEMVEGWNLEEAFSKESVNELLENYIGSAVAIYHTYIDQLVRAKVKN